MPVSGAETSAVKSLYKVGPEMNPCGTAYVPGKRFLSHVDIEYPIFEEADGNSDNRNWEVIFD